MRQKVSALFRWLSIGFLLLSAISLFPLARFLSCGGAQILCAVHSLDARISYSSLYFTWWNGRIQSSSSDFVAELTWGAMLGDDADAGGGSAALPPGILKIASAGYRRYRLYLADTDIGALKEFEEAMHEAESPVAYADRLRLLISTAVYRTGEVVAGLKVPCSPSKVDIPAYLSIPIILAQTLGQACLSWQLPVLALIPIPLLVYLVWVWLALLVLSSLLVIATQFGLIDHKHPS